MPRRVVVIGAGLSGLSCAFDLLRAGADVHVLEASERAGGVTGTLEHDGFRFELGPNTVQASARAFRELCGDLGIADRLIPSSDAARTRWLYWRGRLHALPTGPLSLLSTPLLGVGAKLRLLSEPLRRRAPVADDEPEPTAGELFHERLGPEPKRLFAGAFVRGIYAGDVDELGARSAFPRMWSVVNEHGGIVRGMLRTKRDRSPLPGPDVRRTQLLSFPRGLGELVAALADSLGSRLSTSTPVEGIEREDGRLAVRASGERVEADEVVVATPVGEAARLLARHLPGELASHLEHVPSASVTLVHLGFDAEELELPEGFGFLVPPPDGADDASGPSILGAIFASNLFGGRAPARTCAVSCFYRGEAPDGLTDGLTDVAVLERARSELATVLRTGRVPDARASRIIRWKRAIPQYRVGHAERMRAVREALPRGLRLIGNALGGVGVEPVIAGGRRVAREILS